MPSRAASKTAVFNSLDDEPAVPNVMTKDSNSDDSAQT
jgi:hypothetical protein